MLIRVVGLIRVVALSTLMVAVGWALPASAQAAPTPASQAPTVTFTKDVAPILFENCTNCHRAGEVAPFPLLTYQDAKRRAGQMADVVETKYMPPWLPVNGHGDFADARHLSEQQIKTLRAWADAGAPEGNPADLPPTPKFTEGWALGEPDLVVKMPEKYTLRAEGKDVFRVFVIPLDLPEDKYVTAVDYRPSNRKILHHALLFTDSQKQARKLDAEDKEPGYGNGRAGGLGFLPSGGLGGWAPGVTPRHLPDGVARILHKGADLVIQVHFHPSGKIEQEQSQIGLYFAKKEPQRLAISLPKGMRRSELNIPPGEKDFTLTDSFDLPLDAHLIGVFPHAHLLCKEIKVDATLPDGTKKPLIWIKDWDWNWQDEFLYDKTIVLPRGTKIDQKYVFDNSADNPRNPNNPPKRVTWGEQTADEMAITFFLITAPKDALIFQLGAGRRRADAGGAPGSGVAEGLIRDALRRRSDQTNQQAPSGTAQ